MKPQATKKLFAFIIMMMFSFSFLQAQYCSGNKVGMCKTTGLPECKCVNKKLLKRKAHTTSLVGDSVDRPIALKRR